MPINKNKSNSLSEKYLFLDNAIMRCALIIAGLLTATFVVKYIVFYISKFVLPGERGFFNFFLIALTILTAIVFTIVGITGKIIFHNIVKIKCKRCGEVNRGDIEYCIKCDNQIQDFKSNDLLFKR